MENFFNKKETKNIYLNPDKYKLKILRENKGKSGIYKWNNLITNESYIGSTVNLGNRLKFYYYSSNLKRVLNKESSIIYNAILKYNLSNFSLEILEYCKKEFIIEREQYYMNIFNPEYNILKKAGSRLGHKLSEETKNKLSTALRGRKLSVNLNSSSKFNLNSIKKITDLTKLKLSSRSQGITVKIYDKFSNILINEFPSLNSAAKFMNVHPTTISRIFNRGISYNNYIYKFEIKNLKIFVYDINNKLINILVNKKEASKVYNIPKTTLHNYIKSGKLFKEKYYFRESENNI